MYTLFAHGGDLTAGRRTAAYVYGDWSVSLPDGVDSEPEDKYLGQGYIARVNDKPRGRFDHTFIKEGASIDMQSRTTDLELVLDDAFSRTDGDVFFQHDIEGVGLNGTMPERDYTVGDLVRVMRWNRAMILPVTGTSLKSDDDGRVVGSTHVGGELISSKRTTQKLSDELRRSIARETTEIVRTETKPLRGDVSTIRSSVTSLGTDLAQVRGVAEAASGQSTYAVGVADSVLKTVDLATGDMGKYLDQVQDLVVQAGDEVSKAETARKGAESTYTSMKTLVTQASDLNTQVGQKVADAQGLVKQVKQVSEDLDPKVKAATDLLAKATEANATAIKLNNDADALRDRSIIDLSEAGRKLSESQTALQNATTLNTDSITALKKSQEEHAAATRELGTATKNLGTAQQALKQAVDTNSKSVKTLETAHTALAKVVSNEQTLTSSLKKQGDYNEKVIDWVLDVIVMESLRSRKSIALRPGPFYADEMFTPPGYSGTYRYSYSARFGLINKSHLSIENMTRHSMFVNAVFMYEDWDGEIVFWQTTEWVEGHPNAPYENSYYNIVPPKRFPNIFACFITWYHDAPWVPQPGRG